MNNTKDYAKHYTEDSLFKKVAKVFAKAGISVIYGALILYFSLSDPSIPAAAKVPIITALGYFISPIDLVADPTPVIGYGDDLGVIAGALALIAIHISEDTKNKAKRKVKEWFPNATENDFKEVDEKINNSI